VQEKLEQPEQQGRLDIQVTPELAAKLELVDQLAQRVKQALLAKRGLRDLQVLQESQEKQELRASLAVLERLAKQGLLERLGLPVPRELRVVVVQVVKPVPPALRDIREKLDRLDSQE
jgi:hypothetical protein